MRRRYPKYKVTTAAIEALLHSVANGNRHIYAISIADIINNNLQSN